MVLLTVKVYLFTSSLTAAISGSKGLALSLCYYMGNALDFSTQLPAKFERFTDVFVEAVDNNTQNMISKMATVAVSIVKSMILFALDLYLGTYACLLTALFKGILDFVADIALDLTEALDTLISAVLSKVESALSSLTSVISSFLSAIEEVVSLFSTSDSSSITDALEKVNSTVASMTNITLPTGYIDKIETLSSEIPDFEDVITNFTLLLTEPLTLLLATTEQDLNSTFLNYTTATYTSKATSTSRTNCDEVSQLIDDAINLANKSATNIYIGIAIATLLVASIVCTFIHLSANAEQKFLQDASLQSDRVAIGNLLYSLRNGLTSRITANWDPKLKWILAYVTTHNLMTCLSLACCAFLVVGLQFVILKNAQNVIKSFEDVNINALVSGDDLLDSFADYLSSSQDALTSLIHSTEDELLSLVNLSATSIVSHVETLQTTINDTITSIFGDTVFASPLRTVVYCTIGRKLDSIEEGFEWMNNNLNFTVPSLDIDLLLTISDEIIVGSIQQSENVLLQIVKGLESVISQYTHAIITELYVAIALIAVWFLFVAAGFSILLVRHYCQQSETPAMPYIISWPRQVSEAGKLEYKHHYSDPFEISPTSKYSQFVK